MLEARKVIRSRRNLVEILDYEGLTEAAGEDGQNGAFTSATAP
jgi:hypothetical protein